MFYKEKEKIALCFIISYDQILNKEHLWKEWIEPNKDIINVYFFYKDFNQIKSKWIKDHAIPSKYIVPTDYFHIIPAYFSLMNFAVLNKENKWFCFLTDSCCPIITPSKFRELFMKYKKRSFLSWSPSFWNIYFHNRANLKLLPEEFHLANTPWFLLTRENVNHCLHFIVKNTKIYNTISQGDLANESLFAIIFKCYNKLENSKIINAKIHLTDWSRMTSPTSPHLFIKGDTKDIQFIDETLKKQKYAMFIRKMSPDFPDEIIRRYITEKPINYTAYFKSFCLGMFGSFIITVSLSFTIHLIYQNFIYK